MTSKQVEYCGLAVLLVSSSKTTISVGVGLEVICPTRLLVEHQHGRLFKKSAFPERGPLLDLSLEQTTCHETVVTGGANHLTWN